MSSHALPDKEVQDEKFVGQNVLVPRPAFEEPLVPNAAYEFSVESLSHSFSAASSPQERAEQPHLMDQDVWGESSRIIQSNAEEAFHSISEDSARGQHYHTPPSTVPHGA